MSKIYKALEHARQEQKGLKELPLANNIGEQFLSKSHKKIEINNEMVHLYQTIKSLIPDSPKKVIQFIGPCKGVGTSTMIREFARVSASILKIPVLLLDANRHSCHTSIFGIKPESGLAEVIRNNKHVKEMLHQVGKTRLFLGRVSMNGDYITSIFDSPRIEDIFEDLKQEFDLILIDSPSGDVSTDAFALSPKVDGVILIVEAENTRWHVANDVKERVIKHGGNILGVILNKRKYYIPEFIYKRL
jgi:protein-tyrosine kinase